MLVSLRTGANISNYRYRIGITMDTEINTYSSFFFDWFRHPPGYAKGHLDTCSVPIDMRITLNILGIIF